MRSRPLGIFLPCLVLLPLTLAPAEEAVVQALEGQGDVRVRAPSCLVSRSIVIEAPVEEVWAYVGQAGNAREWSVYFHHISPLPGPADGTLGAFRRCFRRANEQGKSWDEELVGIVPLRLRHIRMFEPIGFPGYRGAENDVWQRYEPLGPRRTRLEFRSAPVEGAKRRHRLLFRFSAWRTERTFELNLANIKAAVEQGAAYARPHPYWE